MQTHNSDNNYGVIAKSLHWVVGLLMIAVWLLGFYAEEFTDALKTKYLLFGIHKSLGMLILLLVIVRLSWRLYDGNPKFAGMNPLLVVAAKTVHFFLYVLMFIQPLSGWAMSSSAGYPPSFFNWFKFPDLVAKNPELVGNYVAIHNTAAWLLLILVVMHVSAALLHYLFFKDNILKRML